jgi:hypothetical protein
VEKITWISFGLGEGVLSLSLVISIISLCMLSPCLGVGMLKVFVSIFSICIWLNLMYKGDFRVKASFGWLTGVYFTLVLGLAALGFFRVEEEKAEGLVVFGFESAEGFVEGVGGFVRSVEGFMEGVFFVSFSFNSCFWFTSWVMTYFICFSSTWCLLTFWLKSLSSFAIFSLYTFLIFSTYSLTGVATIAAYVLVTGTAVIIFGSVTMSKLEDDEGIGKKVEGKESRRERKRG